MADTEFSILQSSTTITFNSDVYNIETTVGTIDLITIGLQGPEGIQGPAGNGATTYVHDQSSASTLWVINHNLNMFPSVEVVDSSKRKVLTEVQYISANTIHVIVAYAFAGQAYLN